MTAFNRRQRPHPDQLPLKLTDTEALERIIAERVAEKGEADAFIWRLRLVMIETLMMGWLVAACGMVMHQKVWLIVRSAVTVAGACFVSGMLLIGLSAATGRMVSAFRKWRRG